MAAIAPWFCLRLPSCGRGFKSQAHHLNFFNLYYWNCNEKRTKINKKRPGLAHKKTNRYRISITSFGLLDGPLEEDLNSFLEKDIFGRRWRLGFQLFWFLFRKTTSSRKRSPLKRRNIWIGKWEREKINFVKRTNDFNPILLHFVRTSPDIRKR